jgi:uncharacterized protein (TIGR00369 family)
MVDQEVPNHWQGNCFGCSTVNASGLKLRFYLSENGCYTKCAIPDQLCGIDGLVHGGMVALLLDEVSQWTMIARIGQMGVTREFSVRYLKPVPTNTEVIVEATIEMHDERDAVLRSTVRSQAGETLAEGESKWRIGSPSLIARVSQVDESEILHFLSHYPVKDPQVSSST